MLRGDKCPLAILLALLYLPFFTRSILLLLDFWALSLVCVCVNGFYYTVPPIHVCHILTCSCSCRRSALVLFFLLMRTCIFITFVIVVSDMIQIRLDCSDSDRSPSDSDHVR